MITRTSKGAQLTWQEMDQNLLSVVNLTDTQIIDGFKSFLKTLKVGELASLTNSNGGSYIDLNDGQISIGTGLNSASNVPEISIQNYV
jgi:hypothetical protein